MAAAIKQAGIDPREIGHVNAHATSTPVGDMAEVKGIKRVVGDHVVLTGTKSMTGHLLGGAGAVESIAAILAIVEGVIPPTINLEEPDEGCDLDYVANQSRPMKIDYALSNSFGFGGTNATLAFRRWRG